jgi:hypothetical protein
VATALLCVTCAGCCAEVLQVAPPNSLGCRLLRLAADTKFLVAAGLERRRGRAVAVLPAH